MIFDVKNPENNKLNLSIFISEVNYILFVKLNIVRTANDMQIYLENLVEDVYRNKYSSKFRDFDTYLNMYSIENDLESEIEKRLGLRARSYQHVSLSSSYCTESEYFIQNIRESKIMSNDNFRTTRR